MAITTTLQVGTINFLTDTFTSVLDLNDRVTFFAQDIQFLQPDRVYSEAFNMRTPGVTVQAAQYGNGSVKVRLFVQAANTTAILSAIHSLFSAIEQPPYYLKVQPAGGTQFTYYNVVKVTKPQIPYQAQKYVSGIALPFDITFTVAPKGITLPRQYVSNLVMNPGFEVPSGPGVQVFADTFANVNAYGVVSGAAPTVGSNIMVVQAGSQINFGSATWGAINLWQLRWQWTTGQTGQFYLHLVDGSNQLYVAVTGTAISLIHLVGGVSHTLATSAITLTNTNWYWLKVTQFPTVSGFQSPIQVTLFNDSAGSVGAAVSGGALGPINTFDAVTALTGKMAIFASLAMQVGGAFAGVQTVNLFGPGGWTSFGTAAGTTGLCSGALDGTVVGATSTLTNTVPVQAGVPVTSYGSARIDLAPAGTIMAGWTTYTGGAPAGTAAIPASATQVLGLSVYTKSLGLHATNASTKLLLNEYDANGGFLRQDTIASALGGTTNGSVNWVQLSGTVTLGASCAYVAVIGQVNDTAVAGESANGTVWFDNAQCWNQTTTGQTTMAWHDLRGPQAPYQLMVSGLIGDVAAPAFISLAAFASSLPINGSFTYQLGRRATATKGMRLLTIPSNGGAVTLLDATAYGGFTYVGNPGTIIFSTADEVGTYHILARTKTSVASPSNNVWLQPDVPELQLPPGQSFTFSLLGTNEISHWQGAKVYPLTTTNTWTIVDVGQVILPPGAHTTQSDLTQLIGFTGAYSGLAAGGSAQLTSSWIALLPVDGGLLSFGVVNPPSNATITNQWIYVYDDGRVGVANFSMETTPLPNPAHAGGAIGGATPISLEPYVTSGADSIMYLDPTTTTPNSAGLGVNQFLLHAADNTTATLPVAVDMTYYPSYLFPK